MIMRHSVQTSRSQTIGRGPSGSAWDRRTAHTTAKVIMATAMSRRVEVLRFRIDSFRIDLCLFNVPKRAAIRTGLHPASTPPGRLSDTGSEPVLRCREGRLRRFPGQWHAQRGAGLLQAGGLRPEPWCLEKPSCKARETDIVSPRPSWLSAHPRSTKTLGLPKPAPASAFAASLLKGFSQAATLPQLYPGSAAPRRFLPGPPLDRG